MQNSEKPLEYRLSLRCSGNQGPWKLPRNAENRHKHRPEE